MADVFPFAALAEAAGSGATIATIARAAGLPARTIRRWSSAGVVPAKAADRVAVALGHHPAEIWPTAWSGLEPDDWSTDV